MRAAARQGLVVVVTVVAMVVLAAAPAGAAVAVSPVAIDFGPVPIGTTATGVVTVSNTGSTPFGPVNMAGGAPITPEFSGSQNCVGVTLPVGGSCELTLTFTPTAPGAFTDASRFSIGITANQQDHQQFTVDLRGTGVDPAATTTTAPPTTTTRAPSSPTTAGGDMEDAPPSPSSLTITFAFATVDVGDEQTATVAGLAPDEQVTAVLRPGDVDLGAQTADSSGTARITFTLADDTDPGLHEVVVTGSSGQVSGTFEVAGVQEVLPVSTDEDGSDDATNWWLVAGLVVAVAGATGIGAYLVGSRSSTPEDPTPEGTP